jgi:hypothetical protein
VIAISCEVTFASASLAEISVALVLVCSSVEKYEGGSEIDMLKFPCRSVTLTFVPSSVTKARPGRLLMMTRPVFLCVTMRPCSGVRTKS